MPNMNTYTSQQLREELERRGLPTEGNKADLFVRLQKATRREAGEAGGDGSENRGSLALQPSTATGLELPDNKPKENVVPPEDHKSEAAQQQETKTATTGQTGQSTESSAILNAILALSSETKQQFDQLSSETQQLRSEVKQQNERFDKKFAQLSVTLKEEVKSVEGKIEELENKIKEMEARQDQYSSSTERDTPLKIRTVPMEPANGGHKGILKPPAFDGETPFENFKVQFQAAVRHNGWDAEEQLNALILALRGKATDVLQTIPATDMTGERIWKEMELRYGQSHIQELCKIQLHNRRQQRGESLQDVEREVTKLARQAYGKAPIEFLNGLTVDAFINAVKDDHLKLHLRTNAKGKSMNEVLALALEYEAARASLSTDSVKLRKLDSEDIAQIEALIDKRIPKAVQGFRSSGRRSSRSRLLCFKCQQPGHYMRDCKELKPDRKIMQPENRDKRTEGQIARWIERLQAYAFKIEHRRGRLHNNADGMSRRPCAVQCRHCAKQEEKDCTATVKLIRVNVEEQWTKDQLKQDQEQDDSIGLIIKWVTEGGRPQWQDIASESATIKSYWAQWQSLRMDDGLLVRTWESADGNNNKQQIVLPANRVPEVLQEIHNGTSGAHLGINKTLDKIRDRFYWVNYRRDVEDWCRTCNVCAASKGPQTRTRGKMQQYNVGAPFERIAMDIAGPFPVTKDGNRYILVCIDYFSKWVEAYPITNQEARTVADAFVTNWVCRFGVPLELHSDQGRNFESSVFQELCQILNIKKTRTTPLHPQSDGMVERFNRTLEEHLRKEVNANQDNWDRCIPLFMMGYRSAVHDTTGNSPSMVVFGRELRLPCDIRFGTPDIEPVAKHDYVANLRRRMINVHAAVRSKILNSSDRMKTRYDLRANSGGFQEGDLVWLYNPKRKRGRSPKLQQSWEGPYKIIKRINDVVYRIQQSPRSKMKVVHIDRLTQYNGRSTDESVRDEQN